MRAVMTFDLIALIHRQREVSLRAFGPGERTAGVLDHLQLDAAEVRAAPHDPYEWADLVLLALDGAWRAGFEPEEIAAAIAEKQARNETRQWPDWQGADLTRAIEHVRGDGT